MTRNWNTIRAKLADPFDPDWERVEEQVQAMMAEQDARGGHIYTPFRLPESHPFTSPFPAEDVSPHPSERPKPTRAKSISTMLRTRKSGDSLETSPSLTRKGRRQRSKSDSVVSKINNAVTAAKRAAFGKKKDRVRQRENLKVAAGKSKSALDLPHRGPKREADNAKENEESSRKGRRRGGTDGRRSASRSDEK